MRLEIKGLGFSYNSVSALKKVNLMVKRGEILAIIGPNASGKTTLLKCIDSILKPQIGSVLIKDEEISTLSRKEIARKIGYLPQTEGENFPITVFDMILMGRRPHGGWKPSSEDLGKVSNIIGLLGLDQLAMREVGKISGGQRQKVMIARALAQEPEVLLLDEPTNNLDLKYQLGVLDLVRKQVLDNEISCLVAIHDLNLAARYSDKIVILNKGEVYAAGGVDVLTSENIESVYGIKVTIRRYSRRIIIIPEGVKNKVK